LQAPQIGILALFWADVDTSNSTISVSKQVIRVNGALKVLPPKTKNAVRKIVVLQQTIELLQTEHERHPDSQLLFPSPKTDTYLDPLAVARKLKTLLRRAGMLSLDMQGFSATEREGYLDYKKLSAVSSLLPRDFSLPSIAFLYCSAARI